MPWSSLRYVCKRVLIMVTYTKLALFWENTIDYIGWKMAVEGMNKRVREIYNMKEEWLISCIFIWLFTYPCSLSPFSFHPIMSLMFFNSEFLICNLNIAVRCTMHNHVHTFACQWSLEWYLVPDGFALRGYNLRIAILC